MRKYAFGALLSCAALFAASNANANTGVAFVHGTGSQTNAYQDYWQPAMVNNVRNGLANPANYVVINCDFNQYMWDSRAAGCLAGQLTTFINAKGITRLIKFAHGHSPGLNHGSQTFQLRQAARPDRKQTCSQP